MGTVQSVVATVLKVYVQLSTRGPVVGIQEKDVGQTILDMKISVGGRSLYFLCK